MTATALQNPPVSQPIADKSGVLTQVWRAWFQTAFQRMGGNIDKVDAAHVAALAAAPATSEVVAVAGLQLGGKVGGNISLGFYRALDIVANLPATGNLDGDWAYAQNGRKPGEGAAAGTGVPCFWSGGYWIAVTSGVTVTA